MSSAASIARLRDGCRVWALGALMGDDRALEGLAQVLVARWQPGDRLVVLGNMLGATGNPVRTLDLALGLRRRLLATPRTHACDIVFLRGAQEEMWHKALRLHFALAPLEVLDWMLARGLGAVVNAYDHSIADGRVASRNGPSAIERWTAGLRERQALHAGHAELLNGLKQAAFSADGALLFSAAGIDPDQPLARQADAFWWNGQSDAGLDLALGQATDGEWDVILRVIRGTAPKRAALAEVDRVLTVGRGRPALVALDGRGGVLERIEASSDL